VYDIRVVRHEDGWIYGPFCTERKDPKVPLWDTSAAVAQCGIARNQGLEELGAAAGFADENHRSRGM